MSREGDVVLLYYEDQPTLFARIEFIEPDLKKDWYRVTLLLLTVPTQTVTWILREAYINGETFTMGGRPMRLEGVKKSLPATGPDAKDGKGEGKDSTKPGRIIPFKKPR